MNLIYNLQCVLDLTIDTEKRTSYDFEKESEHMNMPAMETLEKIVASLDIPGTVEELAPFGNGHINHTICLSMKQQDGSLRRYTLQQINTTVFQKPEQLMENISSVCAYLKKKVAEQGGDPSRETLTLVPFRTGSWLYQDEKGNCWRCYEYVENSISYEIADTPQLMEAAGAAFGQLQMRLDGYPAETLWETIPHFHDTPCRFATFEQAVREDVCGRADSVREEIDFWMQRKEDCCRVQRMLEEGKLPLRVTHNDTKLNNILFDKDTGKPLCVVDLDTIMPGLSLYDFGDSLRSGASTAEEDERDLSKVSFDLELFEAYTRGYLSQTREVLTPEEVSLLAFSAKLMTMECGIRFLTDYLQGDVYFKIHRPGHNLDRSRTQMCLVADMEKKLPQMEAIVEKCR